MNSPHAFRYGYIRDIYKRAVETGVIKEVEPHTTTLMYKMGETIYFSKGDLDLFEGYVLMKQRHAQEDK